MAVTTNKLLTVESNLNFYKLTSPDERERAQQQNRIRTTMIISVFFILQI